MFSLIRTWINDWVNNREAGDLRRHHGHYDVIVMWDQAYVEVQSTETNLKTISEVSIKQTKIHK